MDAEDALDEVAEIGGKLRIGALDAHINVEAEVEALAGLLP